MRRWLALAVLAMTAGTALATELIPVPEVMSAELISPTDRYDHAVLGDALEWGEMRMRVNTCPRCAGLRIEEVVISLPKTHVFEDVEARVVDVDGDGLAEVVVVETDLRRGASLAIYDGFGTKVAATRFLGQPHRWLAPIGVGDFDGDGQPEIAYIDRPHLAQELVFVRYATGTLTEVARAKGFTNHRIGDAQIWGGIRRCGGDVAIVATGDWTRAKAVTLQGKQVMSDDLGPIERPQDLAGFMRCP